VGFDGRVLRARDRSRRETPDAERSPVLREDGERTAGGDHQIRDRRGATDSALLLYTSAVELPVGALHDVGPTSGHSPTIAVIRPAGAAGIVEIDL
jgi:hypothetical protein